MKIITQNIIITSIMLLAQTSFVHAASNAQSIKNEADNLVAAISNWRTDSPNSIFMSQTTKNNRSKNVFDGDNLIVMKEVKNPKTGTIIRQPKLVWADTMH